MTDDGGAVNTYGMVRTFTRAVGGTLTYIQVYGVNLIIIIASTQSVDSCLCLLVASTNKYL